jgi:MoaA/NifB/PqqE/SkfB family radical SAM enzyme
MVLESRKYLNYVLRERFFNKVGYVILFVTSKCNARCDHCFYWKSLNKVDDLSLDEIKRTFSKVGEFSVLLVSGGEPFMRDDLIDICRYIVHTNKVHQIIIPTNGIQTAHIIKTTQELCRSLPKTLISINPSIDGLEATHNKIRGVDCFRKAVKTIEELSRLDLPNLQITVNTVLSNQNKDELKGVFDLISRYNITHHNLEILRGDPKSKDFQAPCLADVERAHKLATKFKEKQLKKTNLVNEMVMVGSQQYQFRLKESVLKGSRFPFTCQAGKAIYVIYSNGDFALCELIPPIANLRRNDYDVNKILKHPKAQHMLRMIKKTKCSCTHICFLNNSIAKDWHTLYRIPKEWLNWKLA